MSRSLNLYEAVLQWGYDNIDAGVTYSDYEKFLSNNDFSLAQPRYAEMFFEFFRPMERNSNSPNDALSRGERFHLQAEAAFKHLERVELQEAREGARKAIWIAAISMSLTSIIGVAQIVIAWTS